MDNQAWLVLEDGMILTGVSIGVKGVTVGELIFNTAHVGYQEALTDPSYAAQIIVFTSPHIGNTGCNLDDEESNHFWASGLVLREKPMSSPYWRSKIDFNDYLLQHEVVGIAEVDTRYLTKRLRTMGHSVTCIVSDESNIDHAKQMVCDFHEIRSAQLLEKVTTTFPYRFPKQMSAMVKKPHIVVYDLGVKRNILRMLANYDCEITIVPASFPLQRLLKLQVDGVVLSNGPGDPSVYINVIDSVSTLVTMDIPILGICLGHQLLGLALGAKIQKLKFGHHGINHPIQPCETDKVLISSQNHNFAIADEAIPKEIKVTYRSLFDNSIQGIQHRFKSIFGIQGHPEGCPGPTECEHFFDLFFQAVMKNFQTSEMELQHA